MMRKGHTTSSIRLMLIGFGAALIGLSLYRWLIDALDDKFISAALTLMVAVIALWSIATKMRASS